MHRFYCPSLNINSKVADITSPEEIHHAIDVLRLEEGSDVAIFDGKGNEGQGKILSIAEKKISVEIVNLSKFKEKLPKIILACAIPKKSKFEMIIEKATELGVDEIFPLQTKRTEHVLSGERAGKKLLRYETIAINAAKQSQRNTIPIVHPVTKFEAAVNMLTSKAILLIPSLTGERENLISSLEKINNPQAVALFIGPEGDFTDEEYRFVFQKGGKSVSLGKTILKVETAAISALSCLNIFYENK